MARKREERPSPGAAEAEPAESLVEAIAAHVPASVAAAGAAPALPGAPVVGEVVDARHPTLIGRVLVRCAVASGEVERWVPTLQGLPVRVGDRVLLVQPVNWAEPVVTGVVDGFAQRPEAARATAARLELARDEKIQVTTPEGAPVLELSQSEGKTTVRLLDPDVDLERPGKLRVGAKSIELAARQGDVRITAAEEVNVLAETVNLN